MKIRPREAPAGTVQPDESVTAAFAVLAAAYDDALRAVQRLGADDLYQGLAAAGGLQKLLRDWSDAQASTRGWYAKMIAERDRLSLSELGARIGGVSKARAGQMVRRAAKPSGSAIPAPAPAMVRHMP